jgi:hypothetical protein
MPEYADIYVLARDRSIRSAEKFLDEFLPERENAADEYELPQYADKPEAVFKIPGPVLKQCEEKPNLEYRFYWRATNHQKPEYAIIIFLNDGKAVYGLSTDASDEGFVKVLFYKMKEYLGTESGFVGYEHCPDFDSLSEFEDQIENNKP